MRKRPDRRLTVAAALAAVVSLALYAQVPPSTTTDIGPTDISPPEPMDSGVPSVGDEAAPAEVPRAAVGVQTNIESRFGELDVDANGGLSEDEVRGDIALRQNFESLDANDDGQLNNDEYALGADER